MARRRLRSVLALAGAVGAIYLGRDRLAGRTGDGIADRALMVAEAPVQAAVSNAAEGTGGWFARYFALVGVREDNARLRADLASARAALVELDELRAQNERLRTLSALRERAPGTVIGASVIGRGTSDRFQTARIDRGTDDGLVRGMAVLALDGAVGQVLRAAASASDVLLLSDGLSAAGGVVQRSRLRGIVAGGDVLSLRYVRRGDAEAVRAGDRVLSSGEDGVLPEGVPLGTVTSVEVPETGLFLEVQLAPAVRLDDVEEVFVVLDPGIGPWSWNLLLDVPVEPMIDGPDPLTPAEPPVAGVLP